MKIDKFPGELKKKSLAYVLTEEQEAWFREWFPKVENDKLMKASGMKHSTLHRFAQDMGLKKSEEAMRRIRKRVTAKAKRTCEKNGYYDSLRGKPLSAATIEGNKRYIQDVRDGKREHPSVIMQRENPRKYKLWMKHRSEERKKLIRQEYARLHFGLERKTRLVCVVQQKFTRRQSAHRHNALKRGYIIMEDCSEGSGERYNIYYDNQTFRTPRFEQNLIDDGFRIKPWTETEIV